MSDTPRPADGGDYVLDAQGRPRLDRFGRPIRRRPARPAPPAGGAGQGPQWERPLRGERPGPPEPRRPERPQRDPRLDPDRIRRRAAAERAAAERAAGAHRLPRQPRGDRAGAAGQTRAMPAQPAPAARAQHADPRFPPPGYRPPAPPPPPPPRGRRGRGPAPKPRRRRPGCLRRPVRALALLLVLLVLAAFAVVELRLQRTEVFADLADRPGRSAASNWLLVGSDSRAGMSEEENAALAAGGEIEGQRTDAILIAHIPLIGEPTLVSIPRDSYVEVPGYGMDKINAAFAYGGAPLLVETVERATGVRIDHYAEIGFGGFAHVVDAAGGIELCPEEAIDDPLAGLDVPAGCGDYDGAAALGYVRTRSTAGGDLDRVARQREFLAALTTRLRSPAVLLNPLRLVPTLGATTKAVTVGDGDHSWHLAWLLGRLALGSASETVPVGGAMTVDVGDVLLWDEQAAADLFRRIR